jgi:hypothetical protein
MNDKRQLSFKTERLDKRFVIFGLHSAQPIVTMSHRDRKLPGSGKAMKKRQQRDRVRPARHGHEHVLSGKEQLALTDRSNKLG